MICGKDKQFEMTKERCNNEYVVKIYNHRTKDILYLSKGELRNAWRIFAIGE
jgi:hypothetical protein